MDQLHTLWSCTDRVHKIQILQGEHRIIVYEHIVNFSIFMYLIQAPRTTAITEPATTAEPSAATKYFWFTTMSSP